LQCIHNISIAYLVHHTHTRTRTRTFNDIGDDQWGKVPPVMVQ